MINFYLDKKLPQDLYGYWHLSDDLMFFGKYGNFSATTILNATKLAKYSFNVKSPVPSFTGKWAPKFIQLSPTDDGSIIVRKYYNNII
jgi:hypothetical protein